MYNDLLSSIFFSIIVAGIILAALLSCICSILFSAITGIRLFRLSLRYQGRRSWHMRVLSLNLLEPMINAGVVVGGIQFIMSDASLWFIAIIAPIVILLLSVLMLFLERPGRMSDALFLLLLLRCLVTPVLLLSFTGLMYSFTIPGGGSSGGFQLIMILFIVFPIGTALNWLSWECGQRQLNSERQPL